MTFKELIKKSITENTRTCVGNIYKVEMLVELRKVKNPHNIITNEFHRLFIEPRVQFNNEFVHHSELTLGQIKRLIPMFNSKTKTTEAKRIVNYIRREMDKYLFKYDYQEQMKDITKLIDKCLNIMKK